MATVQYKIHKKWKKNDDKLSSWEAYLTWKSERARRHWVEPHILHSHRTQQNKIILSLR